MFAFIRRIWGAAPIATLVLALALVVGAFFGARSVAFWIYWSDPAHREQPIEAWMSPGFVSHSWHVPLEVVTDPLGIPARPTPGGPHSLSGIAAEQGRDIDEAIGAIEASILEFRKGEHAPPPRPGDLVPETRP